MDIFPICIFLYFEKKMDYSDPSRKVDFRNKNLKTLKLVQKIQHLQHVIYPQTAVNIKNIFNLYNFFFLTDCKLHWHNPQRWTRSSYLYKCSAKLESKTLFCFFPLWQCFLPVPGGTPTVHILDVSRIWPIYFWSWSLMSWFRCVWLGEVVICVVLVFLQEPG